ncbi:hypothetical protein [Halobiforma nitratireducens]|uniref:DUF8164 domain-containing protein n=1 Tax=Halobiforma nitratireducens JCM 10879 TaxID=1227454 RepID=M0M9Q5_9EURY|nr:hypothetical protein [Halobiforma nitratireducens]EMA41135.1 hypothetical protein C446_06245 [Halobiforma nitratireducens JCM 10879]
MGGESDAGVERSGRGSETGTGRGSDSDELSIEPFLEGSTIDADGRIEISIFVSGKGRLAENELDVFLKRSRIDPGDRIELGVFATGIDRVEENELSVFHGHEEVIDLEEPGLVRRNATPADSGDEAATTADRGGMDSSRLTGEVADRSADGDYVHPVVFPDDDERIGEETDYALEGTTLDGNTDENPAYIFELNTQDGAPPGEYSLPIVFTYRSPDGVKQVKNAPSVRINDWRERLEPWLTRGLVGGVAVLGLVLWLAIL